MKPSEYAKELGISRQAVYAKIKRGILLSKNVEGKLYIVVDNTATKKSTSASKPKTPQVKSEDSNVVKKDYRALLQAKDETIAVLKETVLDLKESNKQISTTLRSEIDLLKEAFHEMRTLYVHQLEHKQARDSDDTIYVHTEEEPVWIGVKKFFKHMQIDKEKQQKKCFKRMKKVYKKGDNRFMNVDGKLKINANENYEDILN